MPSGKMRSVDAHRFAMVPRTDVPRSAFDVNHAHKTTFDPGRLVPVFVDEVLPGDSIRLRMHAFARLATAIVPMLDNLIFESFFFFVPNRILWLNWERFMGEQQTITDSTDFVTPQVAPTLTEISLVGSIWDYMGVTVNGATGAGTIAVNALPFRAYNMIWNEWFRDQDLHNPLYIPTDDGPDIAANYLVQYRMKRHDYFTTARPWPQKPIMQPAAGGFTAGDELRQLTPGRDFFFTQYNNWNVIGAPVTGIGVETASTTAAGAQVVRESGGRTATWDPTYPEGGLRIRAPSTDGTPDIKVLVNDIRTAMMFQTWQEKNARGGTRYAELVRSHFGVVSPDARLQRPEFLGGGRSFISMNAVQQTSASGITGSTTVLGEQAATGVISAYDHGFSQSFTEHGIILGLVNVRADLTYQQGVRRMFYRKSRFDYYWPGLAHLGEQAVMSKEIFSDGSAGDDDVFGYQERWSEYKYKPSRVSGYFRSSVATPLDMWHLAQNFSVRPVLNGTFILENPPTARVLQTGIFVNQTFLMDTLFETRMVRAMPMYSIPGVGSRM